MAQNRYTPASTTYVVQIPPGNNTLYTQPTNIQVPIANLERHHFDILIKPGSTSLTIATTFFGVALGLIVNVSGKYIEHLRDKKFSIDMWEIWSFFIAVTISVIFFLIHCFANSERKKVIKELKKIFA